jgi:hypothetical protein
MFSSNDTPRITLETVSYQLQATTLHILETSAQVSKLSFRS